MKKFFLLILIFLLTVSGTYAINANSGSSLQNDLDKVESKNKVYSTSEEFLKAEGKICESATDGCNTHSIFNGELGASTLMYCENIYGKNGKEKWSCLKYKNDIDTNELSNTGCTMDYRPVCGEDGNTYSNLCIAGKAKIFYSGECDNYVDNKGFAILLKQSSNIQSKFKKLSDKVLLKMIGDINNSIEAVKLSKIAQSMQIKKITQYTFIRTLVEKELTSRKK